MGAVVVAGEDVGRGRRGCETRCNGKETEGQTDERKEGRKKETEGAGGMQYNACPAPTSRLLAAMRVVLVKVKGQVCAASSQAEVAMGSHDADEAHSEDEFDTPALQDGSQENLVTDLFTAPLRPGGSLREDEDPFFFSSDCRTPFFVTSALS
ncbi:hypothetical protein EYF80_016616 [Liparis tanakae]|uniref:Uncharacterized protein n=1 Tax=Liparis tanakae TaxID=230148 RepID=A0A4Z2I5N4_9TELE|nr:hypothetical protein EYF80_016616 [Liparis tanakae]